ncbi:MAG: DUF5107 domain-containing protein [Firmicutes bacterium]|nr:DUF5107 domain-containing protein [Bacillota bacterium]
MSKVIVREEIVNIPTYEAGEPSPIPMFLDKRVYQGSSGRVYPHPVTDKISDEKTDKDYQAIFLENEYLSVMILPEIGGKIHRIYDKTNGYDAVYHNEVIKPALVGLAGPWVSGGIEFNWPQHHRPSTFDPVESAIEENDDGSVTVWCGEIENMYHTKGMTGFTLRPGCAYLEIKGQIYNPTDRPQTFLWWANPAVAVNENTQSIFPPDVHAVMDHGKRDVSKFPIATGTYYKVDYGEGVDISRYKNIPVPTSYMAYHSDYDFVGNYDYGKNAGILHVADHRISPGKKQWTWGCGDFGKAWDRNLTDENGPYIELMTGVFTDNQPDFTFIAPYEEKTFTQYFIPYKDVGAVKNATRDVIINLETDGDTAEASVYASRFMDVTITLCGEIEEYISESVTLSPTNPFKKSVKFTDDNEGFLTLSVKDEDGNVIVEYTPDVSDEIIETPAPAEAAEAPEDIASLEELFLTATHLEQYRHATYSPEDYYREGLRRDPTDIRLNNGYGKYLYKNARFEAAKVCFEAAIKKSTWKNPNPYDTEPYYNLGLVLKILGDTDKAYDAFYKSVWSSAMQDKGYYQLACICASKKQYDKALDFVSRSLLKGAHNIKALNLKTSLLRITGKHGEAKDLAYKTVLIDPLDFGARYELYRLTDDFKVLNELTTLMRNDVQNYIELSLNYKNFGLYDEAAKVLALISELPNPMLHYYIAYYSNSETNLEIAANGDASLCFPNRLAEIEILGYAIEKNPSDFTAPYLLGNLYYDKGCAEQAVKYWEMSLAIGEGGISAYCHRNLAVAYYNKLSDKDRAKAEMEKAFRLAPDNARIFYELDMLYKKLNVSVKKRLRDMADNFELVDRRDDMYVEFMTLLNDERYFERAYKGMEIRKFHPWEGGEGKITRQYKRANIGLALEQLEKNDYEDAAKYLTNALSYPENLGEGKLITENDNDVYFYLGEVYKNIDLIKANEYFKKAARGSEDLSDAKYYNDRPPEMYFYQAMAERRLGNEKKAMSMFNRLIDYGEQHISDKTKIDYFAVSLPDFDIFDADLDAKNKAHCAHMAALGNYGKGNREKAMKYINIGLGFDASHQDLIRLKYEVENESN